MSSLASPQGISVETSESQDITLPSLQNNQGKDRPMCVHLCGMSKLIQQPLFFCCYPHLRILLPLLFTELKGRREEERERERERETYRNIDVRETQELAASHKHPN